MRCPRRRSRCRHAHLAGGLALLLAGCASALPDYAEVGYEYGDYDAQLGRASDYDTGTAVFTVGWDLRPREVRVIEASVPDIHPWDVTEWVEPWEEAELVALEEDIVIEQTPSGTTISISTATLLALLTFLVGGGGWAVLRRKPKESHESGIQDD